MSLQRPTEILDFFLEKEECKLGENLQSSLFSHNSTDQKMFREDFFTEGMEWKSEEVEDFNVDDLLESYLVEDDLGTELPNQEGTVNNAVPCGVLKDEYLDPLRELGGLPFDAVMDTLDASLNGPDASFNGPDASLNGPLDIASDSGFSTDTLAGMLSPSSGVMSPDSSGGGATSVDTLDADSDLSSTSDLGSMGSAGSSPSNLNAKSFGGGQLWDTLHQDVGPTEPSFAPSEMMSSAPSVVTSISRPILVTSQSSSRVPASSVALTTSRQQPQTGAAQPFVTRTIKLELGQSPRIVASSTNTPTSPSASGLGRPVLKKIRLDTSCSSGVTSTAPTNKVGSISAPATVRTSSPQTIVVTQAGKGTAHPLLRNGNFLKTSGGRSLLLPVNVTDLNQVKTIKIISAGNKSAPTTRPTTSPAIRTLVSTVRPVGSSASGTTGVSGAGGGSRTTFYTTSKGSDGRSLLKVTPTAMVTPNARASDLSRVCINSSYIKEEPSDDETHEDNQQLVLNDEERKLMKKEGLILPSRYPLTKQEERDLKRIRRKIRNKISAQDSRKRKKEYVDGLEDRVKNCTEENHLLQKRIKTLERQNESLLAQLKRFQNVVGGGHYYNKPHNHASTALMMLILSAALFVVPSLRSQDNKGENELSRNSKMPSAGHSRSLLEARNIEGFLSPDDDELDPQSFSALSDHDYAPAAKQQRLDSSHVPPFFPSKTVDKIMGRESSGPPDTTGGLDGVAALIGAMLDRFGSNWTDPGGSHGSLGVARNQTPPHAPPQRASVVVNLNHGRRLRDDLELE